MSEQTRPVHSGARNARRHSQRRVAAGLMGTALLAAMLLLWPGDPASPRGPAGEPPDVPPLQVRPVPALERSAPSWRMPEEEELPERMRDRQEPLPDRLAASNELDRQTRPAIVPPLGEAANPAEPGEPTQVRRVESEALRLAREWTASQTANRGARSRTADRLLAATRDADSPVVVAAADLPEELPEPGRIAVSPTGADGFVLAPAGAEALGSLGPDRPIPALEPLKSKGEPSLFLEDTPTPIDPPSVLGIPGQERGPIREPQPQVQKPQAQKPQVQKAPGKIAGSGASDDRMRPGLGGTDRAQTRVVPEPGTLLLVGGGLALLARYRRR